MNKTSSNVGKQNYIKVFWLSKTLIFLAAFLSMLFSIYLYYMNDRQNGIFVGLWVPSILSAGTLLFAGTHEQ